MLCLAPEQFDSDRRNLGQVAPAWGAAGRGRAVLNWEENQGINGSHSIVDKITIPAVPR
jgi:hypothetical protein